MNSNKIVQFQEEKTRLELENAKYEGRITIYVQGKSFEKAKYSYYLDGIEEEYLEYFLQIILNSLIEDFLNTNATTQIKEPVRWILNKEISIDFYSSQYDSNKFFFEHGPKEITFTQLIILLNSCIANLRQK